MVSVDFPLHRCTRHQPSPIQESVGWILRLVFDVTRLATYLYQKPTQQTSSDHPAGTKHKDLASYDREDSLLSVSVDDSHSLQVHQRQQRHAMDYFAADHSSSSSSPALSASSGSQIVFPESILQTCEVGVYHQATRWLIWSPHVPNMFLRAVAPSRFAVAR